MSFTFIKKGILFALLVLLSFQNSSAESKFIKSDFSRIDPTDPPVVISPINYCKDETAIALTATGTNLSWYTTATGGTKLSSAPIPSTAAVDTLTY
jgi:hypothetical protein